MPKRIMGLNTKSVLYFILIIVTISSGIFIRTARFPDLPPGLSQDEANSAYESFSLATTGQDRWGNKFPPYFPSWGSGQNSLQAYIGIPFIWALGLTVFSARLPALLLGILTLPLFFFCLRPLGRFAAFLGLLLLTVAPWHFMLSRWSLESNIAPFFMLLGCTITTQALIKNKPRWIIPSLLPFALALYAYGTTIIILPILFAAILALHYKTIITQIKAWLWALFLFLILAAPFLIFFVENYVTKRNLPWTDQLFFSTPVLLSTRLSQVKGTGWLEMVRSNAYFIRAACSDGTVNHVLQGYKLLLYFTLPLILLGPLAAAHRVIKGYFQDKFNSEYSIISVFLSYAAAALTFIFLFTLNVNRFNHFYIPILALCAWFAQLLLERIKSSTQRYIAYFIVTGLLVWEGGSAVRNYFEVYPQGKINDRFNTGLQEAFAAVAKLEGIDQVLLSRRMALPDAYALFYLKYPPEKFRQEVDMQIAGEVYQVNKFGKYAFYDEYINPSRDYGYLSRKNELCEQENQHKEIVYTNERWEVGIMRSRCKQ